MKNLHLLEPGDIRMRLEKLWNQGKILSCLLDPSGIFPLRWPIRLPGASILPEEYSCIREWIKDLESQSKSQRSAGYDIVWEESNHRILGKNRLPRSVRIDTFDDAVFILRKRSEAERFRTLVQKTRDQLPELLPFMKRKPLGVLSEEQDWERILRVLAFFKDHPRPGIYLRQLDIPGIDTKFIESRKGLFSELWNLALQERTKVSSTERRIGLEEHLGLRTKPFLIRFRILDPRQKIHGLSDLSVPIEELSQLSLSVQNVFITENDINGLAFPPVNNGLVIFGLGYALDRLSEVSWLGTRTIHYWGDIDTHGFSMLSVLRGIFPNVRSFLMDRETFVSFKSLWVREDRPAKGDPDHLTKEERALYLDIRDNRLGENLRLEQERIPFSLVREGLLRLELSIGNG